MITPGSEDLQPPFDMVSVRETFNNVRGRRSNIMLEKLAINNYNVAGALVSLASLSLSLSLSYIIKTAYP